MAQQNTSIVTKNTADQLLATEFNNLNNTVNSNANDAESRLNTLSDSLSSQGLALVSSNDTTEGYLEDKVIKGPGIIRTILNEGGNEQLKMELGPHYKALASSGLYTGAELSIGSTTGTFDISEGEGLFIDSASDFDNINVQGVAITARTNLTITNLANQNITYILIDKDDNIVQLSTFPTPEQRRDNIFIGSIDHTDRINVVSVTNVPSVALDVSGQLQDLFRALGKFNLIGNIITPAGGSLEIDKSSGQFFKAGANFSNNPKDPHTITSPAQSGVTFRYINQNGIEGTDTTLIDPSLYDNNGTDTSVPNNDFTIQHIYILPGDRIRIQRGQETFSNLSEAIDAVGKEEFITESNIQEHGLLLCSLVLREDVSDLSNTSQARFFTASRFGELGSVGSSGTTTLQDSYNNSIPNPEILTSDSNGPVTYRRGTTGDDSDIVFEVQNNVGTTNFSVDGNGSILNTVRTRTVNTASPTAILQTDGTILFDTSSTSISIDLPLASVGKIKVPFKDIAANADTNNITINRSGADTIVTSLTGQTSAIINVNGDSGYFLSNGVDTWYLFGAYQNLS